MTWHDELRRLDEELAAGRLSAEDYRQRRDQLMKSADADTPGTPPGGQPAAGAGQPSQGSGPFPPPFRWESSNPDTTQVVGQGSSEPPADDSTQVVRSAHASGADIEHTQVVPNAGTGVPVAPPAGSPGRTGLSPQVGGQQPAQMNPPGAWQSQQPSSAPPWAGADLPPSGQDWYRQGPEVFEDNGGSGTRKKIGIVAGVVLFIAAVSFGAYWVWGRDTGGGTSRPTATGSTGITQEPKEPLAIAPLDGKVDPHSRVQQFTDVKKIDYLTPEEIKVYEAAEPDEARMAVARFDDDRQIVVLNVAVGGQQKADEAVNELTSLQRRYNLEPVPDMPVPVKVTQVAPRGNAPATIRGHYAAKDVVVRIQVSGKDMSSAMEAFRQTLDRQLKVVPAER
ncbi:hypothetical protein GCM10012275_30960 [Longimycelium tulufanense]|uniref:SHOCT domain-containing protein n=1 Tax=Longimycelium tulufanense TaxID=907463 RepID=A0A8J3CF08_9PSEU|nr:hypothetical protein [Longimycelium tulufanense]GGM57609.1 hypothetical protein GCM10012275_30960 [Longimycelium tulufanense]